MVLFVENIVALDISVSEKKITTLHSVIFWEDLKVLNFSFIDTLM